MRLRNGSTSTSRFQYLWHKDSLVKWHQSQFVNNRNTLNISYLTETRTAWYCDGISENICCTYSQTQVICIEELYFYLYFFFYVSSVILNLRLDITIYVQCITQLYFMYISHLYSSIINSIIILLYSNMYVYLCCFKVISPPTHTHKI